MEFEWDLSKELENVRKHLVSFLEAVESFSDPDGFQLTDAKHSQAEPRFYWVGKSGRGRTITTRFTQRGNVVRITGSASWRKFRRLYDERTQTRRS